MMNKMNKYIEKAAVLIEALPYIQKFRDATVVVKFGGSAMEVEEHKKRILQDTTFMECVGMKSVIVHGGGKAISRGMEKKKVKSRFLHGLRVTDEDAIHIVHDVLTNEVNQSIIKILANYGAEVVQIKGEDIIVAEKMVETAKDGSTIEWGFVGNPVSVNPEPIFEALRRRQIPVITPLGKDAEGNLYNINADVAAAAIAAALKARKLVFLSDVPGLMIDIENNDTLISTLYVHDVEKLIERGIISGGMLPKINSGIKALKSGVHKIHMVDGRMQHSLLLELFTTQGVGTEIIEDGKNQRII
ncbi:MAG: acetylglutamate kinase [Kiritimatiellae bacterium]|jgi:acetylglutamate kinase|nr:acetylglutamate kinase [Kiritimatiellia bacterium]